LYRFLIDELKNRKNSTNRKPIIIEGAKRVGKTWLMKEFGNQFYNETVYVDLSIESVRSSIFSFSFNASEIISKVELFFNLSDLSDNTLIVFDEIQYCPDFLNILSSIYLTFPEYHILCASSSSFDQQAKIDFSSNVDFITLHPLSFKEFLIALNKKHFVELLDSRCYSELSSNKNEILDLLKTYYFVGGMPEAVCCYSEYNDLYEVREIQNNILRSYKQSFQSEFAESCLKISRVWDSIPFQLSKDNKKFIYGLVFDGGRARDYESSIRSMLQMHYVCNINRVTSGLTPLDRFKDNKAFKLFVLDIGLLCAMFELDPSVVIEKDTIFTEFNGALTEQYVVQQLQQFSDVNMFYYTNDSGTCEIDFLIELLGTVIPVEARAIPNLKSKSVKIYSERFIPNITAKFSLLDYSNDKFALNLPLYAIENFVGEIKETVSHLSDLDHFDVY